MSDWKTIPKMLAAQAERFGVRAALKARRGLRYTDISWNELKSQVDHLALGLLELEVGAGDRVGLLSENRPEWVIADLSILSVGAATVPVYTSLTPEEIEGILRDAGVKILFVSGPDLLAKVLPFQEALNLKVILLDAPYRASGPRVWWMGELIGLGKTAGPGRRAEAAKRLEALGPETLASLIYTSGTTGAPKGVMLTHGNFLSNCRAVAEVLPLDETDQTLSFLPLSHVFERMAGYYFVLFRGGTIAYAHSMESVPEDLIEIGPTVVTAVPRFYEKTRERIEEAIRAAPRFKQAAYRWALRVGHRRNERVLKGLPVPPGLASAYAAADWIVFSKVRTRMGGRIRFFVSGGAPLSKTIAEYFYMMGLPILEGYGLTETSPVITVNRVDRLRFGTVGRPLPGVEVRIAEDGEVLTRGPHVMQGYFRNPKATAEVIDKEGWFHTGDVGSLSPEGYLTITDRKKDLIKTSGGKMVAPQRLEALLKTDGTVEDCVVVGDRRKFVTALIVPNRQKLAAWARKENLPFADMKELVEAPRIRSFFEKRVERVNRRLASFEQIKKFALLPEPFTQGSGELTPTLKVKRRIICERYADRIEALYR